MIWEWLGEGSIERTVEVVGVLSDDADEYGGGYTYDELPPVEQETFAAKGLTWTEVSGLRTNVRTKGSTYTITDKIDREFTGRLTSVAWKNINGCDLFEVTVNLLIPPAEPS